MEKEKDNILQRKDTTTKIKWGIYLEGDVMRKIKKEARETDRSINYIINRILVEYYDGV